MSELALSANGLCVELGGRPVLQDFALAAARGEINALWGPNGAGKSSALRALAGLLPSRGELTLLGRDLRALSRRERAQQLAYVPQQSLLQTGITVRDVVLQGRYAHDPAWPGRRQSVPAVERALSATAVAALADRSWNELSGGEKRRVLLARALATEAPVILLDEPTAALDIAHALRFLKLLRELARAGRCIVVVLHDLDQVSRYADRAVLLHEGRTIAAGATPEVVTAEFVREVYGVELEPHGALGYRLLEPAS
jgi:iron complex transport system ATP-binding protein